MGKLKVFVPLLLTLTLALACRLPATAQAAGAQGKSLRILATSDLHGKFVPWDYALNAENASGSVTQLATASAQYRTDDTLLVDAGDTIQDNAADIFVGTGDVHPMVQALNALNYDVWVTGNHEYNYGMDVVKKTIADMKAKVLTGNVYDENGEARANAEQVVGRLVGGPLAPENEIADIPAAQVQDTALIDLINRVHMYYTGAPVSAAALSVTSANLYPGDIRKCDMALIYKYTNTLYKLRMTGAQLKKYMEWSANYYQTFTPGDLTVAFNPDVRAYNYDMFEGVNYDVNVANEPGHRIENLTWPDGRTPNVRAVTEADVK